MKKRYLVLIALLMLGFVVAGCDKGSDSLAVDNLNPDVFTPMGSISGVVWDDCLSLPVPGAKVSVNYSGGVHTVVTGEDGTYGFSDVPANTELAAGGDSYTVVCDLTDVASTFAVYGYALTNTVDVYYDDLEDGQNSGFVGDATEGGSGADTPVNNLNANCDFGVATPSGTISGVIYDVTTGKAPTAATVTLYAALADMVVGTTTSDATTGAFSFSNVVPSETTGINYKLRVKKAGYVIANQDANCVTDDGTCYVVDVTCPVLCPAAGTGDTLSGVNVNIWADTTAITDQTAPFITSVLNGTTEVYDDDDISAAVSTLAINFSEAMDTGHTAKDAITDLKASGFTVTVTSGGAGGATITPNAANIIDFATDADCDTTVAWDTAGDTITITLATKSSAELMLDGVVAAAMGAQLPAWTTANCTAAVTGAVGIYTLEITENWNNLMDVNFNPWLVANFDVVSNADGYPATSAYTYPPGVGYQNGVIFTPTIGVGSERVTLTLNRIE